MNSISYSFSSTIITPMHSSIRLHYWYNNTSGLHGVQWTRVSPNKLGAISNRHYDSDKTYRIEMIVTT